MKKNYSHYLKTLKFWRAVEAFNLPDLTLPRRNDPKYDIELKPAAQLPWEQAKYANSEPGKKWKHTLYFGCIFKEKVMDAIRQYLDDNDVLIELPQTLFGRTWMSALVVDASGKPYDNTYTRAAFSFALKALLENKSFDEINEWLQKAQEDYNTRFKPEEVIAQNEVTEDENDLEFELVAYEEEEDDEEMDEHEKNIAVTWTQITKELEELKQSLPAALTNDLTVWCISEQVAQSAEPEPPFLNSFYTNDLNTLIDAVRKEEAIGGPMERYLQEAPFREVYDMQDSHNVLQYLHPSYLSPARWPANPNYGLYSAQQVAVNLSLSQLKEQDDLLGINGPPGTGKTTLLREIIADIIFTRAERLMKFGPDDLFEKKRQPLGKTAYYDINTKVFGNDGILIASNNNAAVANISEELPRHSSIDINSFPDADYMAHVAKAVCKTGEAWGMLSAVLGNAGNCSSFQNAFWKASGFGENLDELSVGDNAKRYVTSFDDTKDALTALIRQFRQFQEVAMAYHDGITGRSKLSDAKLSTLKAKLTDEYKVPAAAIPDRQFTSMDMTAIHKLTPYSSPVINKLRSEILLKSLDLHLYAILINAKYFRANLDMFLNMLIGKNSTLITDGIAQTLWQTFFFCVPVISSSLASIERFMKKLTRRSIGWLLLDEAGQAAPQYACGAIWRAQRCIIIGDTMQVPPVVTMPEVLGKVLEKTYDIDDAVWSPLYSSAQLLADRATPYGTYIDKTWTGIPLRAHRRCADPMFSIANKIAYNDQMVKVTVDSPLDICLKESAWINVKGTTVDGHFIEEEFELLKIVVDALQRNGDTRSIFIISPFRSVLVKPYQHFRDMDNVACGTIHTFQGKEADIVFVMLGSDPARPGARNWVAQTPNMLNVAITRAKKYLYFIGNKDLWLQCNYFSEILAMIPIKDLRPKKPQK